MRHEEFERSHEGACGPESGCDAACMDMAHAAETIKAETELDVLLSRVREDKNDPSGKNRNVVAYDCWRMFEDLTTRYKEESAMRDRYKRQSNSWRGRAFRQADLLREVAALDDGDERFAWKHQDLFDRIRAEINS